MKREFIIIIVVIVLATVGVLLFRKDEPEVEDLYYEASLNDNMINYNVVIIDEASLNSDLYSIDGEWLSEIKDGVAIVSDVDMENDPTFKVKINDKIYTVKKK